MDNVNTILTHPGGAHKDEFLACCVLLAKAPVAIVRREPTDDDLKSTEICVVDVGMEHDPSRLNFDHHQLPRDHVPTCALSLVLQYLGLYGDAKNFCEWLEPAEWFDCRGAKGTAAWLGVERDIIGKLNSPIDVTLLRRFAKSSEFSRGDPLWEMMRMIGEDLVDYLKTLRERIDYVAQHSEIWDIGTNGASFRVIYMPRTEPLPEEPSMGLGRYIEQEKLQDEIIGMVYPDRRSDGYGLSRYNDNLRMEFTQIESETDVHFAHKAGFVAKTTATDPERLKELLAKALKA